MAQLTFRDFAEAIMGADAARGAEVLEPLLGLDNAAATTAAKHFQASMAADPTFMMKAMGLRTAVTDGTDAEIAALLGHCFGLEGSALTDAVATLRKTHPAPHA